MDARGQVYVDLFDDAPQEDKERYERAAGFTEAELEQLKREIRILRESHESPTDTDEEAS